MPRHGRLPSKSVWGKLSLGVSYEQLFPGTLELNGFRLLTSDFRHYQELLRLPWHHRDPFDRLLIAQARVEGMTVVTRDAQFAAYDIPVIF